MKYLPDMVGPHPNYSKPPCEHASPFNHSGRDQDEARLGDTISTLSATPALALDCSCGNDTSAAEVDQAAAHAPGG